MSRNVWTIIGCGCLAAAGCLQRANMPAESSSAAPPPASTSAPKVDDSPVAVADQPTSDAESTPEQPVSTDDSPPESAEERSALALEGISFVVPATWKKVKPQSSIVEAEFELPRSSEDEHDGRLTLMPSGGDPHDVIANRTAEFSHEAGQEPVIEPLRIGSLDATWVDLRGEWKGPSFRPIEPRPDYRMLLVIIPFTEHSAYYVKLTGPRATVDAHEEEFRAFVHSTKLPLPEREAAE